ncbi:MAG TPA: PaaI family thioesterase [Solirubrobacterales bacterium]
MSDDPAGTGIGGLNEVLGIELLEPGDADGRARAEVAERILQPYGLVHAGLYSAIAETIASAMTSAAVSERGEVAMGQSNTANFLRPITAGTVHASGRVIHRGRTSWVWDVECADDEGRVAAVVRVVIAVRPRPGG